MLTNITAEYDKLSEATVYHFHDDELKIDSLHIDIFPNFIAYGSIHLIECYYNYNKNKIIANLFLFNKILVELNPHWLNCNIALHYQRKLIDQKRRDINFVENYYNDLVKYTNKMMVLI